MKRYLRSDDGVAIVELALIAPFLIVLALGIVDLGLYARDGIEVGNAARAGVQYGAQSTATSQNAASIVNAARADAHEVTTLTVTPSTYCTCDRVPGTHYPGCTGMPTCATGDHVDTFVQVISSKQFTPFVSLPGLPSSLLITKTASQEISP